MYYSQLVERIHLKHGDISLNTLMMMHSENGDSSSKGVSVAARRMLIFHHENLKIYISAVKDPICPKLHMLDTRSSLNTSTLINSEKVIAPPVGNSEFKALYFQVPWPQILWHNAGNWSAKSSPLDNPTLWRLWHFMQRCCRSNQISPWQTKYFLTDKEWSTAHQNYHTHHCRPKEELCMHLGTAHAIAPPTVCLTNSPRSTFHLHPQDLGGI